MSLSDDIGDLANPFDQVEQYRHECEVRTVAGWETDMQRANFLALVEKRRGAAAAQRLRLDVWELMKGEPGGEN